MKTETKSKVKCVTRMRVLDKHTGIPDVFDYNGDGEVSVVKSEELTLTDNGNGWEIVLAGQDKVYLNYCEASDLMYAAELMQRMDARRGSIGLRYPDAVKLYSRVRKYPKKGAKK